VCGLPAALNACKPLSPGAVDLRPGGVDPGFNEDDDNAASLDHEEAFERKISRTAP
jgi:hypothetical protein